MYGIWTENYHVEDLHNKGRGTADLPTNTQSQRQCQATTQAPSKSPSLTGRNASPQQRRKRKKTRHIKSSSQRGQWTCLTARQHREHVRSMRDASRMRTASETRTHPKDVASDQQEANFCGRRVSMERLPAHGCHIGCFSTPPMGVDTFPKCISRFWWCWFVCSTRGHENSDTWDHPTFSMTQITTL